MARATIKWMTRAFRVDLLARLRRLAAARHWTLAHAHDVVVETGLGVVEKEKR